MPLIGSIDNGILQVQHEPINQESKDYRQEMLVGRKLYKLKIMQEGRTAKIDLLNGSQRFATEFFFLPFIDAIDLFPPHSQFLGRQQILNNGKSTHPNFFDTLRNLIIRHGLPNVTVRALFRFLTLAFCTFHVEP
jgi:hypothetical protein